MSNYSEHIARCNAFCQASPENTARMLHFVVATIQQGLETVPVILESFEEEGTSSRFAFGSKRQALKYISEHSETVYADALKARNDPIHLMKVFLRVPGLGTVKAGFACQLFANLVGCLDVHNIKLYSIPRALLRSPKELKTERAQLKRISKYVSYCERLGGSETLWRNWCDYKASLQPLNWDDAGLSVSLFHFECLTNSYQHNIPDLFDVDYRASFVIQSET